MNNVGGESSVSFADLDNDGDLDMISGHFSGNYYYFQNISTATAPNFATGVINSLGLTSTPTNGNNNTFVDLDNDGDFDIMSGVGLGDYYYYKNIGTVSNPNPVGNTLTIQLEKNAKNIQVSIMSIEGKLIYTKKSINSSAIIIDLANWSNGIYIVKLNSIHENKTIKL